MQGRDADGAATVSFWFQFDWRLPSGVAIPFEAETGPSWRRFSGPDG